MSFLEKAKKKTEEEAKKAADAAKRAGERGRREGRRENQGSRRKGKRKNRLICQLRLCTIWQIPFFYLFLHYGVESHDLQKLEKSA
jgi:hypothetical protein